MSPQETSKPTQKNFNSKPEDLLNP